MDLIKRLFGGGNRPELATPSQLDARPEQAAIEADTQATKRRELVRVLTRDTLRATGVPESWVESQILLELSRGGQPFIHLRLVVKQWDERLMKYAVAFQRRLLLEISQFEPNVREWLLSITWQYDVGDACPYLDMPDPATWAAALARVQARETVPAPVQGPPVLPRDELQEDLARLYAVRDADLAAPAFAGTSPGNAKKPAAPIVPDILL